MKQSIQNSLNLAWQKLNFFAEWKYTSAKWRDVSHYKVSVKCMITKNHLHDLYKFPPTIANEQACESFMWWQGKEKHLVLRKNEIKFKITNELRLFNSSNGCKQIDARKITIILWTARYRHDLNPLKRCTTLLLHTCLCSTCELQPMAAKTRETRNIIVFSTFRHLYRSFIRHTHALISAGLFVGW